jgi:RecB family exonuclease
VENSARRTGILAASALGRGAFKQFDFRRFNRHIDGYGDHRHHYHACILDGRIMAGVVIRASSLGRLFDCPAAWAATHIDGRRLPSNGKATLGKAVHASTALYDQSVIDGAGITIDEAAGAAVDAIYKPDEEVVWDEDNPQDAEKIAVALHIKYCQQIAPRQNYLGVEIQCEHLEITDLGIALTGTTDRIRQANNGGVSICDIKTGKAVVGSDGSVKTAGHTFQMGVYELLAEHASRLVLTDPAQIIGLNTAKTPVSQRVGTGEITGARDMLLGDGESPGILEYAARVIHSGNFFGNPRSMACGPKYCAAYADCKFRE